MQAETVDIATARTRYAFSRAQKWGDPQTTVQLVKGLPVAVRSLGLAQAVAQLARRGKPGRQLSDDVCGWLLEAAPMKLLGTGRADAVGLIERVVEAGPQAVRAAEEEAIRFLEVLKLFGELVHGAD